MASSENKNVAVTIVLVLSLIFATLANSTRYGQFMKVAQESGSENRSSGSFNWTPVSGGRPVRSDPNTVHHHESRAESSGSNSSNWAPVSGGRPVRSDPNTVHHHKSRAENGGSNSSNWAAVPGPRPVRSDPNPYHHYNRTASPP